MLVRVLNHRLRAGRGRLSARLGCGDGQPELVFALCEMTKVAAAQATASGDGVCYEWDLVLP